MPPASLLPPTQVSRRTRLHPSTPLTQNTADLQNAKSQVRSARAAQAKRNFELGAPVHSLVTLVSSGLFEAFSWLPFLGAAPAARRGFLDFCGNRSAWFLNALFSCARNPLYVVCTGTVSFGMLLANQDLASKNLSQSSHRITAGGKRRVAIPGVVVAGHPVQKAERHGCRSGVFRPSLSDFSPRRLPRDGGKAGEPNKAAEMAGEGGGSRKARLAPTLHESSDILRRIFGHLKNLTCSADPAWVVGQAWAKKPVPHQASLSVTAR